LNAFIYKKRQIILEKIQTPGTKTNRDKVRCKTNEGNGLAPYVIFLALKIIFLVKEKGNLKNMR